MISIDIKTGAGIETPPAVGACSVDQVVRMAPYAAPWTGTGLPSGGSATSNRLRGLTIAGTSTGVALGSTARPSVPTTALQPFAVTGDPAGHASSTPGDPPPDDPLSQ